METQLQARFGRPTIGGPNIKITGLPYCGEDNIFSGIVEHCCQNLSVSELTKVISQLEGKLSAGWTDDVLSGHRKLFEEVTGVLADRRTKKQLIKHPLQVLPKKRLPGSLGPSYHFRFYDAQSKSKRTVDVTIGADEYLAQSFAEFTTKELMQAVWWLERDYQFSSGVVPAREHRSYGLLQQVKQTGLSSLLRREILKRTGKEPAFLPGIKANFGRSSTSHEIWVEGLPEAMTDRSYRGKFRLYNGLVDHCAEKISLDVLYQICWELQEHLAGQKPEDVPLSYLTIYEELRDVIKIRA